MSPSKAISKLDDITILRKYGFLPPVAAAAAMSGEDQ